MPQLASSDYFGVCLFFFFIGGDQEGECALRLNKLDINQETGVNEA